MSTIRRRIMASKRNQKQKTYLPTLFIDNRRIRLVNGQWIMATAGSGGGHITYSVVKGGKTYNCDSDYQVGFRTPSGYAKDQPLTEAPISFPYTPSGNGWICWLSASKDIIDLQIYEV